MSIVGYAYRIESLGLPDSDPYPNPPGVTNTDLTVFGNGLRVIDGEFRPSTAGNGGFYYNTLSTGNAITVGWVMASTTLSDRLAGMAIDASGDGFAAIVNFTQFRVFSVEAFELVEMLTFGTVTDAADGDFYWFDIDDTTMSLYKEAGLVSTWTVPAQQWYGGMLMLNESSAQISISEFGVDGVPGGITAPSVNPTGTDVALTVGTAAQIVMQDMAGATATALTLRYTAGGLVVNTVQADFDYTAADADTGTIDFTATRGNLPYGSSGYQYVITLSAGDPVTYAVTSLSPAAGFEYVVAASPVSDNTGIIYQVVSGTPSSGDQAHWQTNQGSFTFDIRADFTFAATSETFPEAAAIPVDYWNSETGTWYALTVNVAFNEDGGGTVTGITARNITLRGITARNITARLT